MRASQPVPGDPWPHDMVIHGEERPRAFMELLWVREAFGLDVGHDVPRLVVTPRRVDTDAETRAEFGGRWPHVWDAALAHAADFDRSARFGALISELPGSVARMAAIEESMGPGWRTAVGDVAFETPAYRRWEDATSPMHIERPRRIEDHPERRDLDALIPAWRAGLTRIISLPVDGPLARRAGRHGLLVSEATRADSSSFRNALSLFLA